MAGVNRVWLVGAKGSVCVDAFQPRLAVWAQEAPWTPPRRHPDDPMGFWSSTQQESGALPKQAWTIPGGNEESDARHFLDCLAAGRTSDVNETDAATVLEELLMCYASAAKGRTVSRDRLAQR
jgi:predicted dehydrogenase